jgi:hypothetical protein
MPQGAVGASDSRHWRATTTPCDRDGMGRGIFSDALAFAREHHCHDVAVDVTEPGAWELRLGDQVCVRRADAALDRRGASRAGAAGERAGQVRPRSLSAAQMDGTEGANMRDNDEVERQRYRTFCHEVAEGRDDGRVSIYLPPCPRCRRADIGDVQLDGVLHGVLPLVPGRLAWRADAGRGSGGRADDPARAHGRGRRAGHGARARSAEVNRRTNGDAHRNSSSVPERKEGG